MPTEETTEFSLPSQEASSTTLDQDQDQATKDYISFIHFGGRGPSAMHGAIETFRLMLGDVNNGHPSTVIDFPHPYTSEAGRQEEYDVRKGKTNWGEQLLNAIGEIEIPGLSLSIGRERQYYFGPSKASHEYRTQLIQRALKIPTGVDENGETKTVTPNRLVLQAHCTGLTDIEEGFINDLYKKALEIEKLLEKNPDAEYEPLLKGIDEVCINIISSINVPRGYQTKFSGLFGKEPSIVDKLLKVAEYTEKGTPDVFNVEIHNRRTNEEGLYFNDPKMDELAKYPGAKVLYAGFRHHTKKREGEASSLFYATSESSKKAIAYKRIPNESDASKEQRIREALGPSLVDNVKWKALNDRFSKLLEEKQVSQENNPKMYRELAKQTFGFDFVGLKKDPEAFRAAVLKVAPFDQTKLEGNGLYDILISANCLRDRYTNSKMGKISEDLMQDYVELLEKKELNLLLDFCEDKHNEEGKHPQGELSDLNDHVSPSIKADIKKLYNKTKKELTKQNGGETPSRAQMLAALSDKVLDPITKRRVFGQSVFPERKHRLSVGMITSQVATPSTSTKRQQRPSTGTRSNTSKYVGRIPTIR